MTSTVTLSAAVTRMLHDKLYEKRKIAALEIEKLVKSYAKENCHNEISNVIEILRVEYILSQNINSRKGGLIALAACTIALGSQDAKVHIPGLLKPVIACTTDPDSRMRYFACESLYNTVKVARSDTLIFFNELFDALSKLSSDPDQNVRAGSELLDRLIKDVVTETPSFDATILVEIMRNKLYTKKQYTRKFLVSWLICLVSIPYIDIIVYLPDLIDPLFLILGDTNMEIQSTCQQILSELIQKIKNDPEKTDFPKMTNLIVVHSQSSDNLIKETALKWLVEFIQLAKSVILPFASGILSAILPTLAYDDFSNSIWETAKKANHCLMLLITNEYDVRENMENEITLPLAQMIEVFIDHLKFKSTPPKIAVIRWLNHLLVKIPFMFFKHVDAVFKEVMQLLSDNSNDLVILTLECLAEIASSPAGVTINRKVIATVKPTAPLNHKSDLFESSDKLCGDVGDGNEMQSTSIDLNTYFIKAIDRILMIFKDNPLLLENRASFIIRQLSSLLNAENVYRAMAEALPSDGSRDVRFCAIIVKKLNGILMSSTELVELRDQLKNDYSQENSDLFCCLYKSWCHNPIAAVTLCLLTQNYQHCSALLHQLANYEMTVDLLVETDKLVQLIESPIFAYLRLQLLECPPRQYLVKSLYSLLMLLPQGRSFDTLHHRLNSVPNPHSLPATDPSESGDPNRLKDVNFNELFQHFTNIQDVHAAERRQNRLRSTNTTDDHEHH